jgi:hypothetical protein
LLGLFSWATAVVLYGLLVPSALQAQYPRARRGQFEVQGFDFRRDGGCSLSGGPVESVEAVSGVVHSAQIDANTLRVVITGNLSSGAIARVRLADVTQASRYSATVNQVAARSSYVPQDPGQYSISLAP